MTPSDPGRLRARLRTAIAARLSPERTRRPTLFERATVQRLSWEGLLRLNRHLELVGKLTTGIWVAFLASAAVGVDWQGALQDVVNSGRRVTAALALVLLVSTLAFIAARSSTGFLRWRVQRELWRRDVARLERESAGAG